MTQSAAVRPEANFQRKAAIAHGGVVDHAGRVTVAPIPDFDLDRTIFQTLEGRIQRYVMKKRVGKEIFWSDDAAMSVQKAYDEALDGFELPAVNPELVQFLVDECDFDVEHADGSFLDHLYFCYEYTARHYPQQSALVMLLHSILGTGTNTFAMETDKIPALKKLMSDFDWRHTEAFPSMLRLLYAGDLTAELQANAHRADEIESITMHRVIDNATIELSGDDLWIALNYQLIHLVDFMPVANWSTHMNDTSFILFRRLLALMERAGRRDAKVAYTEPAGEPRKRESLSVGGWLTTQIPVSVSEKMAAKGVRQFSERIGHSLDYRITWR